MEDVERSTAAAVGYHLPGGPLIEQANATKTLALADMAAFKTEGLLSEADIANLDGLIGEVHKGLEDRTVATSETRAQTAGQATAMRDAEDRSPPPWPLRGSRLPRPPRAGAIPPEQLPRHQRGRHVQRHEHQARLRQRAAGPACPRWA
jgi:hypothetical protein